MNKTAGRSFWSWGIRLFPVVETGSLSPNFRYPEREQIDVANASTTDAVESAEAASIDSLKRHDGWHECEKRPNIVNHDSAIREPESSW